MNSCVDIKDDCSGTIDYLVSGGDVDNVVKLCKSFNLKVPEPVVIDNNRYLAVHYTFEKDKFCVGCDHHYRLLYACYCDNEVSIKKYFYK